MVTEGGAIAGGCGTVVEQAEADDESDGGPRL